MVGMRVHTDGSTHRWFGEAYPYCDLCILLDDADGRILSAALFKQEGVLSTFALPREARSKCGRFGNPIGMPAPNAPEPYLGRFPKIAHLKGPVLSRNSPFGPQWEQISHGNRTGHL